MKRIFAGSCLIASMTWLISTHTAPGALSEIPADPAGAAAWKAQRISTIKSVDGAPLDTAIPVLATIVGNLKTLKYRDCPERDEVLEMARSKLMSIPGYADYYADRLRAARDRVEAETDPNMKHSLIYRELKPAAGGLSTLARLPSPDSVRVLGEFLNDERGRFIQDPNNRVTGEKLWGMLETRTSNSEYAVEALISMPIIGKPKRPDISGITDGSYEIFTEVPAWREWYERIKSGRATFRFEGDPVEYDLNGPAPPEKLARLAADRARDADRANRRSVSTAKDGTPSTGVESSAAEGSATVPRLPLLLAGALLAGTLLWYLFRRIFRKNAAP